MTVTGWVVFVHSEKFGTFTPKFTTLSEAEEFSNTMKVLLNVSAISEPIPVVSEPTILSM